MVVVHNALLPECCEQLVIGHALLRRVVGNFRNVAVLCCYMARQLRMFWHDGTKRTWPWAGVRCRAMRCKAA